MNLMNKKVEHKQFGVGVINNQSGEKITVQFNIGEKKFQYPMAFEHFLVLEDEVLRAEIAMSIQNRKTEIENENKARKAKEAESQPESIKPTKLSPTIKVKKVKKVNKLAKVIELGNDESITMYIDK